MSPFVGFSARSAGLLSALVLLAGCGGMDGDPAAAGTSSGTSSGTLPSAVPPAPEPQPTPFTRVPVVTTNGFDVDDGLAAWRDFAPAVEDVTIVSTADGNAQPAYWLAPAAAGEATLVVLHSWSTGYERGLGAPYAQWAAERGWAMVAPDFRGANERPEATGSPLAVQDVLDAVDWALAEGGGDPARVFVVGLSGGGMMSLLAGGAAPGRFAGVVAWAPVVDIADFYAFSREIGSERGYLQDIEVSCGGDPTSEPAAAQECARRSPASGALAALRTAGTPVYLGVGERDEILRASGVVRAFNALADPAAALDEVYLEALDQGRPLPGPTDPAISFFTAEDPRVFLAARSAAATLVVFSGRHEMVYNPGLAWMATIDSGR